MLHISFVGAIGGEGTATSAAKLPDGLNFRLPAGQALMINTHWLNATDNTVDGQAVIDVKFADATPDHTDRGSVREQRRHVHDQRWHDPDLRRELPVLKRVHELRDGHEPHAQLRQQRVLEQSMGTARRTCS